MEYDCLAIEEINQLKNIFMNYIETLRISANRKYLSHLFHCTMHNAPRLMGTRFPVSRLQLMNLNWSNNANK